MLSFRRLFGFHEIDEWRDEHTLLAATILNQTAADLITGFEPEVASASWKDGLVGQSSFIATRIAPHVRRTTEPIVARIVEDANQALARIVAHQAVWHDRPAGAAAGDDSFEAWQDVAAAAAPLAGGVALAAALPAAAVTTSTAFFGLVTTTAISWPVVLGGGALVGLGLATGAINTAKIWDKTEARLRRKVCDHVVGTLIEGTPERPSILMQLSSTFDAAAERAKEVRC